MPFNNSNRKIKLYRCVSFYPWTDAGFKQKTLAGIVAPYNQEKLSIDEHSAGSCGNIFVVHQ